MGRGSAPAVPASAALAPTPAALVVTDLVAMRMRVDPEYEARVLRELGKTAPAEQHDERTVFGSRPPLPAPPGRGRTAREGRQWLRENGPALEEFGAMRHKRGRGVVWTIDAAGLRRYDNREHDRLVAAAKAESAAVGSEAVVTMIVTTADAIVTAAGERLMATRGAP